MGLKDDIVRATKRRRETKKVDGQPWGIDGVHVLKMSGLEWDQYQQDLISRSDRSGRMTNVVGWRAKLVAMCACDEEGLKIFDGKEDWQIINSGDPDSLELVFNEVRAFNRLAGDTEDIEGNLDGEAGSGSSAVSPSTSANQALGSFLDGSPVTT